MKKTLMKRVHVAAGFVLALLFLTGTVKADSAGASSGSVAQSGMAAGLSNEVILARANGMRTVYPTINSAYSVSGTADEVYVGSGTYNEQLALTATNATNFFFEAGAVLNWSGSGATISDGNQSLGVVNIGGFGILENMGTCPVESVLSLSGSGTYLQAQASEVLMTATGGSATSGTNACMIKVDNGGFVNLVAQEIIATNCSVLERTGNGVFWIKSSDRIASSGSGVSTIVIGDAYPGTAMEREYPGWISCKRFISDPNERVFYCAGVVPIGIFYIEADRIGGCLDDESPDPDHCNIWVRTNLWCPEYNADGSIGTTTRPVCNLNGLNSYYNFQIGTLEFNGDSSEIGINVNGGESGENIASVINVQDFQNVGSGISVEFNSKSHAYVTLDGGPSVTFNGGQDVLAGDINTLTVNGSGLTLRGCSVYSLVNPSNYAIGHADVTAGSFRADGDGSFGGNVTISGAAVLKSGTNYGSVGVSGSGASAVLTLNGTQVGGPSSNLLLSGSGIRNCTSSSLTLVSATVPEYSGTNAVAIHVGAALHITAPAGSLTVTITYTDDTGTSRVASMKSSTTAATSVVYQFSRGAYDMDDVTVLAEGGTTISVVVTNSGGATFNAASDLSTGGIAF